MESASRVARYLVWKYLEFSQGLLTQAEQKRKGKQSPRDSVLRLRSVRRCTWTRQSRREVSRWTRSPTTGPVPDRQKNTKIKPAIGHSGSVVDSFLFLCGSGMSFRRPADAVWLVSMLIVIPENFESSFVDHAYSRFCPDSRRE